MESYGAICPKERKGAGLVLPRCNTQAMTLHLAEISKAIEPGNHGVALLDQVGWHGSKDLDTVYHRRLQRALIDNLIARVLDPEGARLFIVDGAQ